VENLKTKNGSFRDNNLGKFKLNSSICIKDKRAVDFFRLFFERGRGTVTSLSLTGSGPASNSISKRSKMVSAAGELTTIALWMEELVLKFENLKKCNKVKIFY
jgi:hypothetical protein